MSTPFLNLLVCVRVCPARRRLRAGHARGRPQGPQAPPPQLQEGGEPRHPLRARLRRGPRVGQAPPPARRKGQQGAARRHHPGRAGGER